jgi:peroxin-2
MAWVDDIRDSADTLHLLVQQQTSLEQSLLKQFPAQHVLRIFQLDALLLETEVAGVLKSAMDGVLNVAPLEFLTFRYSEELQFLLQSLLYKFGVWDRNQSVTDRMQNLLYRNEAASSAATAPLSVVWSQSTSPTRTQKVLHYILSLVVPFLFKKLSQRSLEENWANSPSKWKSTAARSIRWIGAAIRVLQIIHVVVFLMEGRYRSMSDRLVGMRLVVGEQRMQRLVNLVYLNQHVAWQSWSSFLTVALPAMRLGSLLSRVSSVGGTVLAGVAAGQPGVVQKGYCCACREPLVLCRRASPCGHSYCHHCIVTRLQAATTFPCTTCGATIDACFN